MRIRNPGLCHLFVNVLWLNLLSNNTHSTISVLWIRIQIRRIRNLGLLDPDPSLFVRILLSLSKKIRKTLISTVFWLLYEILSLKNDLIVPSKSNREVAGILKAIEEKRRIRIHKSVTDLRIQIRIHTKMSAFHNTVLCWNFKLSFVLSHYNPLFIGQDTSCCESLPVLRILYIYP